MRAYEFSIIASGLDPTADDFESHFYDAGCDDATISFQKGHIIVDFAREAGTMDAAVASAVAAVRAAGAVVERVEPDPLVNLSEIASRSGMTRAAISQYAKGQRGRDFPAPVAKVTSDRPLWDWAVVARWLFRHRKLLLEVVVEAEIVKQANRLIECGETELDAVLRRRAREAETTL